MLLQKMTIADLLRHIHRYTSSYIQAHFIGMMSAGAMLRFRYVECVRFCHYVCMGGIVYTYIEPTRTGGGRGDYISLLPLLHVCRK